MDIKLKQRLLEIISDAMNESVADITSNKRHHRLCLCREIYCDILADCYVKPKEIGDGINRNRTSVYKIIRASRADRFTNSVFYNIYRDVFHKFMDIYLNR